MTSNNGIVMDLNDHYLRETNVKILQERHRLTGEKIYIGTIPTNLVRVLPIVSSYGNSGNREKDLIEKVTCIIAVIPWVQAFLDANRRTGIIAAGTFLRDNGYDLDIDPYDENLELRSMLSEIKKHARGLDPNIMKQMSFYISKRIKKL